MRVGDGGSNEALKKKLELIKVNREPESRKNMVRQEQKQQQNQITINNNKKTFSVHVRKQNEM